ncbi:MAG: hypothetical protein ABIT76_03820 [Chthoniobacterales bacterium]
MKPKKGELEAAVEFSLHVCQRGEADWPSICQELCVFDQQFASFVSSKKAAYEFTLSIVSVQLHAVTNLFESAQSGRIRSHVLECFTNEEVGNYPVEAIAAYDAAWDEAFAQREAPFGAVAAVLSHKLGLKPNLIFARVTLFNPIILSTLGMVIFRFEAGWWKKHIEAYDTVA